MEPVEYADEGVRVDVAGPVVTVTLNRPTVRNAMRPSTWRALADIGSKVDRGVRVVVVRGAGESFCAGLDRRLLGGESVGTDQPVTNLFDLDPHEFDRTVAEFQDGFRWLRDPHFISIAAVQGHAIGGGFQLALACDIRIMTGDAVFCMREPALGIVPDVTGSKHLIELVGYSRALEITASARFVDAMEAERIGLANRVVPRAALDEAVAEFVDSMTQHPHGAVSATKRLFLGAADRTFDEQRSWERVVQYDRFQQLAAERWEYRPRGRASLDSPAQVA